MSTKEARIGLRIGPQERERLRLVALVRDVSMSEVVREAVHRELERAESEWGLEGSER